VPGLLFVEPASTRIGGSFDGFFHIYLNGQSVDEARKGGLLVAGQELTYRVVSNPVNPEPVRSAVRNRSWSLPKEQTPP